MSLRYAVPWHYSCSLLSLQLVFLADIAEYISHTVYAVLAAL